MFELTQKITEKAKASILGSWQIQQGDAKQRLKNDLTRTLVLGSVKQSDFARMKEK